MTKQEIKHIILTELPIILETDAEVRQMIIDLAAGRFSDRRQTDDRFDRILDELRRDREESARKWDENTRKWEENSRRWDENEKTLHQMFAEMKAIREEAKTRHDHSIGALGARWGIYSEQAFRNGLRAILEMSFGVQVLNLNEFDHAGEVFGKPDQVEIDIIIRNGETIVCEIKSAVDKSDVYVLERKARFYEKHHGRPVNRILAISPMIDERAKPVAAKLGIETYTHSQDVLP